MDEFYEAAAERLAVHLAAGRTVALLAAGDPLFYSSYMHMHKRLADRFDAEVIPGVTSVSAASAALGKPLVEGEEILTILPGTLPQAELTRRLKETDAAAILKLGRTFHRSSNRSRIPVASARPTTSSARAPHVNASNPLRRSTRTEFRTSRSPSFRARRTTLDLRPSLAARWSWSDSGRATPPGPHPKCA